MNEIARWLVRVEIPILSLAYLYFILSDQLTPVTIILIILVWAGRAWLTRKITVRTPFDLPILLILFMLPVSLSFSPNLSLTLPKIYGILLSLAFFYAIVNHIETPRDVTVAQFSLVLLCLSIALAGLIGTDWVQSKIVSPPFIYDHLPRVIQNIPRSIAGGFARNGIGGSLTFTIPLLAAMAIPAIARAQSLRTNDLRHIWFPRIVLMAIVLSIATLALTQSRGAILGSLIGLIALVVWKRPRLGLSIISMSVLLLIVLVVSGQAGAVGNFVVRIDSADGTLASRLEVWQRGLMMVQDFAFTGIGIGTYSVVAHTLYPFFIAAPDEIVPHAHNQFLQVAVDLGIPGLVAYIALLTTFVVCAARAYRTIVDERVRALIVGLAAGMLAHHTFGLTDAFILGSKPGLLMWIYSAVVAGCYVQMKAYENEKRVPKQND